MTDVTNQNIYDVINIKNVKKQQTTAVLYIRRHIAILGDIFQIQYKFRIISNSDQRLSSYTNKDKKSTFNRRYSNFDHKSFQNCSNKTTSNNKVVIQPRSQGSAFFIMAAVLEAKLMTQKGARDKTLGFFGS